MERSTTFPAPSGSIERRALHRELYGESPMLVLPALLLGLSGDVSAAMFLLALPVGLAATAIGLTSGILTALACSLLLLCVPAARFSPGGASLASALAGIWGTVGLIWLTRRPVLSTLQWSWTTYEQNRHLLEQARDVQVDLKETLQDLADANAQLARLNDLAQALRYAAEDARRAKERFVANVSHELRTPLNVIVGFSEMIVQTPNLYGSHLSPKLLADLEVILRNSQHLSKLIDDVLDLSQVEAVQRVQVGCRVGGFGSRWAEWREL